MYSDKLSLPIFIVDAFTNRPFSGNQAAVCLISDASFSKELKQNIAFEMNFSETAFITLLHKEDSFNLSNTFKLEWFSPTNEITLCGHATLASSLVLFKSKRNVNKKLHFSTLSGTLSVSSNQDGSLSMDFPQNIPKPIDSFDDIYPLVKATIGNLEFEDIKYSHENGKLLIRLKDHYTKEILSNIKPSIFDMIKDCPKSPLIMGVIVTLLANDSNFDFYSRFFAPWLGVDEDPVTGSAHVVLGPYWAPILNKKALCAQQCSQRSGELMLFLKSDDRIIISGNGVLVMEGSLTV